MKRLFSICIAAFLVLTAFPVRVQAAAENITLTVAADKSTANPGDTVNFAVKLGAVNELGGGEFVLSIPDGMTFVQCSIPTGLETTLNADGDGVNCDVQPDGTYKWSYGSEIGQAYSGVEELTILEFSCTVDADAAYEIKSVSLSGASLFDATLNNGDFTSHVVTVVPAQVTVAERAAIAVTGVSLDQSNATLREGGTVQLTATVEPADADEKSVTWSSDNTEVATVSASGLVTAVREGTANITVTTQDGNKTAVCVVTVPHQHSMSELIPAVAATCTTEGTLAHYTCTVCHKNFADEEGTTELTSLVAAVTEHVYDNDADGTCNQCGYVRFYVVIEGADSTYSAESGEGLTFKVDGDFDKFSGLKINGEMVDAENYTAAMGSTVITLKSSFLDTLAPAVYAVEVLYTDGNVATTTITIAERSESEPSVPETPSAPETPSDPAPETPSVPETPSDPAPAPSEPETTPAPEVPAEPAEPAEAVSTVPVSPKTGEPETDLLWIGILAGAFLAAGCVGVYRKKKA